jgi:N-acetylneuraminic acid mutarotase
MLRLSPLHLVLGFGVLAACAEDQNPTQPESGPNALLSAATAAAFASNSWTIMAAPRDGAFMNGASAGVMPDASGNPVVYMLGGGDDDGGWSTSVLTYRVATNTWGSQGFEPRIDVFNSNGAVRIGNLLYISGGENYAGGGFGIAGGFWSYNPATNVKTQKANQPKITAEGVSGVIDGKLYVLPGVCSGDNYPSPGYCETEPFRRLFRYNPATNSWVTKKQAPHFHARGAGGAINGKFYVAGGRFTNVLDRYDPSTDTWTTLAPIPVTASAVTDVRGTVFQGKLFVVSSHFNSSLGRTLFDAFSYDPATNVWTRKARPTYTHSDIVAITWNGKPYLLAVGGIDVAPLRSHPVELYAP